MYFCELCRPLRRPSNRAGLAVTFAEEREKAREFVCELLAWTCRICRTVGRPDATARGRSAASARPAASAKSGSERRKAEDPRSRRLTTAIQSTVAHWQASEQRKCPRRLTICNAS